MVQHPNQREIIITCWVCSSRFITPAMQLHDLIVCGGCGEVYEMVTLQPPCVVPATDHILKQLESSNHGQSILMHIDAIRAKSQGILHEIPGNS